MSKLGRMPNEDHNQSAILLDFVSFGTRVDTLGNRVAMIESLAVSLDTESIPGMKGGEVHGKGASDRRLSWAVWLSKYIGYA